MNKMKVIKVSGTHEEMGYLQGEQLKDEIKKAYEVYINTPYFKNVKPWFLPFSIFEKIALNKAYEILLEALKYNELSYRRFLNIANGANINPQKLALMHVGEILLNKVDYMIPGGCTGIAILPEKSKTEEMMILKNFDYPVEFEPFNLLRISNPDGFYKSVEFTMMPLIGSHEGMNEKGLTILYNYGFSVEEGGKGPLLTSLIQFVLENYSNVDEALQEFMHYNEFPNSAIIMIADRNSAVVLEISPKRKAVRYPENGYLIMTNHYRTQLMKEIDIPSNAVFSKKAIKAVRGIRIHQSDEIRYDRAEELLNNFDKIDMEKAKRILRDHGKENQPSDDTICRHSYPYSTIGSVIFLPNRKEIYYVNGNPCKNEYESLRL